MKKKSQTGNAGYLLIIGSGVLLSTMDSSMVNVALPDMMREFNVDLGVVKLVVLSYLLVITGTLVIWGRLADRVGKGRIYLAGMVTFLAGATICGLVKFFPLLIAARTLQGIGAAMMMASGPAILKLTSPEDKLGRTLGLVGIATSLGLMIGPVVSGVLVDIFSWRAIFFVALPVGILVVTLGAQYLLTLPGEKCSDEPLTDVSGMLLWASLAATYLILLNLNSSWWLHILVFLVFWLQIFAFKKVEAVASNPILPLSLVSRKYYWTGVATASLSFGALFIVLIIMPFYLEYICGFSTARVGLTMMGLPVSLVVVSPISGYLYDRFKSARVISTCGLVLSCLIVGYMLRLDQHSTFFSIWGALLLLGAGQSIFLSPNSASVLGRVDDRYAGITAGILATARNFGMLTGATLAGSAFSYQYLAYSGGVSLSQFTMSQLPVFLLAMQRTFILALILLLIAVVLSVLRGSELTR